MSPVQRATIWSMAASFDLEIIENPPIERRDKASAPALFLWIMWISPGADSLDGARPSHRKSARHAYIKAADDGFMKTRVPRVPDSEKKFDCCAVFACGPDHVIDSAVPVWGPPRQLADCGSLQRRTAAVTRRTPRSVGTGLCRADGSLAGNFRGPQLDRRQVTGRAALYPRPLYRPWLTDAHQ